MTVVWHHEHHRHARYVAPECQHILRLLMSALFLCVFLFGGGWFAWGGWREGKLPPPVESWLYVPIGLADAHLIWYPDVACIARGIAAANDRTAITEADDVQAIDVVIRRHVLRDLAKELDVSVSDEDVSASVTWTDDVCAFQALATWSDREYVKYVAEDLALSNAVESALLQKGSYQSFSQERIKAIQEKLALGIPFADLAKEYSEDPTTAQTKGSFGYVLPSEVDPAFASVFSLPPLTVSDVIVTDDVFWLLQTEDSVVDEDGTRTLLRGIAVKKTGLVGVLDSLVKNIDPLLWVR